MSNKKTDTAIKKVLGELSSYLKTQQRYYDNGVEMKERSGKKYVHETGRPDTLEELKKDVVELERCMKKLIKEQKGMKSVQSMFPKTDKKARFEVFREWIRKEAPNMLLGEKFDFDLDVPEGVGVKALVDMKEDEVFLLVPRRIAMSTDTCCDSEVFKYIQYDDLCLSLPSLSLALHLLFERLNPDSFWKPYLDVLLPPDQIQLPCYFPDDDLKELEGSSTLYDVLNLKKANIRQYVYLWKLFKRSGFMNICPSFRFEDFQWAVSIIMTRQNMIPRQEDPDQNMIALLPGYDFCNYRPGKMATYYDCEADCSETRTMEDVKAGNPIYIYYGERPNSKIFMFNGFVVDDHPTDTIEITLKLDLADPFVKLRNMLLKKRNWAPETGFTFPFRHEEEMWSALQFCRIATVSKDELTKCLKNPAMLLYESKVISEANERKALRFFISQLQNTLQLYPTTYEEDAAILNACYDAKAKKKPQSHSENAQLAIRLRRTEKKLLTEAVYVFEDRLAAISVTQ